MKHYPDSKMLTQIFSGCWHHEACSPRL